MYQQAVLSVADPETFAAVKAAVVASFSSGKVEGFLKSVDHAGFRVREFEDILRKGLLGAPVAGEYSRLNPSDQGQIREFYLASLEKVAPALRKKFFKLYAYY